MHATDYFKLTLDINSHGHKLIPGLDLSPNQIQKPLPLPFWVVSGTIWAVG